MARDAAGRFAPCNPFARRPTLIQMRVLCFVAAHVDATGEGPVFREIANHFRLPHVTSPQWHLNVLKLLGLVEWQEQKPRSIRVTDAGRRELGLIEIQEASA